jgi:hypothetical protein
MKGNLNIDKVNRKTKGLVKVPMLLISFYLTACQTVPYEGQARNVKKKPQESGVIAITTNYRPEDKAKADQYMKENCAPYPVKVLEEGEVAVGQETHGNTSETNRDRTKTNVGSFLGMPVFSGDAGGKESNSSSVVKSINEWQIQYACQKPVSSLNDKTETTKKK